MCQEADAPHPRLLYATSAMLLQRELIRKLLQLFLIMIVIVGVSSLLADMLVGTDILSTLLRGLGKR